MFFVGCDEGEYLGYVEYDEFGTPSWRWNWTDGRIFDENGREVDITSFILVEERFRNVGESQEIHAPSFGINGFGDNRIQTRIDEITTTESSFILEGGGWWGNLQIKVNGELVQHRHVMGDTGWQIQQGDAFRTRSFPLLIGRNEIILKATSLISSFVDISLQEIFYITRTIYIIRY